MSEHPLDRPVWASLTTCHTGFNRGGPLAKRYDANVIPFVAIGSDDAESIKALPALFEPDQALYMVQASAVEFPPELEPVMRGRVVQMLCDKPIDCDPDPEFKQLSPVDAAAMLDLATLTRPGPFTLRSGELGEFWGVKRDGKLLAMAGERFHHSDFGEVSGVCTHPSVQGQGLGRRLSLWLTSRVIARGETPFLHAFDSNKAAIGLYESIGYRVRTLLHVTVLKQRSSADFRNDVAKVQD